MSAGAVLPGNICPAHTAGALGSGLRGVQGSVGAAQEVGKGRDGESFGTAHAQGDVHS